jgi:hypothetical protein
MINWMCYEILFRCSWKPPQLLQSMGPGSEDVSITERSEGLWVMLLSTTSSESYVPSFCSVTVFIFQLPCRVNFINLSLIFLSYPHSLSYASKLFSLALCLTLQNFWATGSSYWFIHSSQFLSCLSYMHTIFPCAASLLSWRWRQKIPPKHWYLSAELHGVMSQNIDSITHHCEILDSHCCICSENFIK